MASRIVMRAVDSWEFYEFDNPSQSHRRVSRSDYTAPQTDVEYLKLRSITICTRRDTIFHISRTKANKVICAR